MGCKKYELLKPVPIAILIFPILLIICTIVSAESEKWKITAYCACEKCCGKYADGICASGKKAQYGYVACNWLPFGAIVEINGIGTFSVQDRGAKSLFGGKDNHIKHLDVYMPTHKESRQFGVKWREVTIL